MKTIHCWIKLMIIAIAISFSLTTITYAQDKTFKNSIGMEFVLIPAGEFIMGSDKNCEECGDNETPRHKVIISKAFYMGKYEVTQEQWAKIMNNNSNFKGEAYPINGVSWVDAQEFISKLNKKEGINRYRLPTEAEWEYACRAGTNTKYYFGDDRNIIGEYAWFDGNSGGKIHPVGQLKPNSWGLYDIYGNVFEWCQDVFYNMGYSPDTVTDPIAPDTADSSVAQRVSRGGGVDYNAFVCRSAVRLRGYQSAGNFTQGFRLILSTE